MAAPLADLPDELPVFPLEGVLLLPSGILPLNVFEPRYIAMVEDALATKTRLIGMIQPRSDTALYDTGCAGRITGLEETEDGRYLVTLTGARRFRVTEELKGRNGYRRVRPDWAPFAEDGVPEDCLGLDRARLKTMLQSYFGQQELSCDWDVMDGVPDGKLITCLSMICPFAPGEKQALLEAPCCRARASKFMTMLEMAVHDKDDCGGRH